jgi:PEP-CTERM motif
MSMTHARLAIPLSLLGGLLALPAAAADITFFNTGDPDGKIATASRPDTAGFEIESADDFVLTKKTSITDATFTGLIPTGASPTKVVVEIYRVFPKDSDVGRTSGSPVFSTDQVPTRVNSPSDVAFEERDVSMTSLTTVLNPNFTVANSVKPGPGTINPKPGETTGGNGPVTEAEVRFDVTFADPFLLPADHYFFVPQVQLDDGDFLWLSAPKPGTPFPPGFTDLQSWTRDEMLDPDWLRVGQDIVGGEPFPTFNAAFSVSGVLVPEPSTWALMLLGFAGLGFAGYRQARKAALQAHEPPEGGIAAFE